MKFGLGTAQFGQQYGVTNGPALMDPGSVRAVVNSARDGGFSFIDTAIAYGCSESLLGTVVADDWEIITKLPPVPIEEEDPKRWIRRQIMGSCSRLKKRQLDGVLLHAPEQLHQGSGAEILAALEEAKDDGLIRKYGISIYHPKQLERLTEIHTFDIVQAPINIIDQRLIRSGWARRLTEAGTEVHARSLFLQGLLLQPRDQIPVKFERWQKIWGAWHAWLQNEGLSPMEACLGFVSLLPDVAAAVVGAVTPQQTLEIARGFNSSLTALPDFGELEDPRLIDPSSWGSL